MSFSRIKIAVICCTFLAMASLYLHGDDEKSEDRSVQKTEEVIICENADRLEQYEKTGLIILSGNVRIKHSDGLLNADKVTLHRDLETDDYTKTVAEGNVEIRDEDIQATCDIATLNHDTDQVELRGNVIVIQENDRLEAEHFFYNRKSGEKIAEGSVKFQVNVKSKNSDKPKK